MMPDIDEQLVRQTARLARLRLDPEQIEPFRRDLDDILAYVGLLDELDLAGVESTAHPFMTEMRLRNDHAEPFEHLQGILENAPESHQRQFKVPRIIADS